MDRTIKIGALMEVPVAALTADYKKLLASLTVANPEYKSAAFFGKGHVRKDIPKNLTFFEVRPASKSILLPRNMAKKYLAKSAEYQSNVSNGRKISAGHDGTFTLRPKQQRYFDDIVFPYIDNIYNNNINIDILLNAQCGSGKTIMALYLASVYQRNTLVCVTTKKIGNQFIKAVGQLFPKWTVGWAEDNNSYDITVGTYALLAQPDYTEDYFRNFGHIVLDEFHRCGATTYSRILEKAPCKHRTSLTATFRRKDGLHKILAHHAGDILEMERDEISATIYPISTGYEINEAPFRSVSRFYTKFDKLELYSEVCVKDPKTRKEIDRGMVIDHCKTSNTFTLSSFMTNESTQYNSTYLVATLGTVSAPMLDNEISELEGRTKMIFNLVRMSYRAGRRVIVLSKRKDQLYKLSYMLTRYGVSNGVFVSDKDPEYKKYCQRNGRTTAENEVFIFNETKVILGIDKLAEEGMDAPMFDTLIYAHLVKDVEQSIGRILREAPAGCGEKKPPVAFCMIDKVNSYRNAFYSKKGAAAMFADLGHKVERETGIDEITKLFENGEI